MYTNSYINVKGMQAKKFDFDCDFEDQANLNNRSDKLSLLEYIYNSDLKTTKA